MVLWSHTKYSVYLVELVFIGICCLPLWLALGYSYPLFLYVADDMRLVLYDSSLVDDCVISPRDIYYTV